MKRYIYIALLAAAISSCKRHQDDFNGEGRLAGQLSYYNPYSGEVFNKPIGKKKVCLAYNPSDTLNFIYSCVTNDGGYFQFTNLDRKRNYDLFYSDTIGGIRYTALISRIPDNDTLRLIATPDFSQQNGVAVTVTDPNGIKLQGITVIAYDNHDIYIADSTLLSSNPAATTNGVHSFKTNNYGYDFWFNVAPHFYYFIAPKQAGNLQLTGYSTSTVQPLGIGIVNVPLHPTVQLDTVGIRVTDKDGNVISGIPVYLYSSNIIAESDTPTRAAFTYQTPTISSGVATFLNVPVANYFIRAEKKIGSTTLKGKGTINVQPSILNTATIVIQ